MSTPSFETQRVYFNTATGFANLSSAVSEMTSDDSALSARQALVSTAIRYMSVHVEWIRTQLLDPRHVTGSQTRFDADVAYAKRSRMPSAVLSAGLAIRLLAPTRADGSRPSLSSEDLSRMRARADDDVTQKASALLRAANETLPASLAPPVHIAGHGGEPLRDQADALVARVGLSHELAPRSRYNLGCYYAATGDLVAARSQLYAALRSDAALRKWAFKDPALDTARQADELKDLLNPPGPANEASG